MATLDCGTYESTINSICHVYGIERSTAEQFLSGIDLDAAYESNAIYSDCDDYLRELFEGEFGQPKLQLNDVIWFHLTRTARSSNFSEGILPLGQVLDRVWKMLNSLLETPEQKANLATMQENGVKDYQFGLKTKNKIHHGPYAMLVREAAFNSDKICNHDYLEVPEIIEDICNGYRKQFGRCIYDTVTSKLEKCIVKFKSNKYTGLHLLAPALLYCWCIVRNEEFSSFANTCFDSEGAPISRGQIISVEFL
ncbi:hypothetical protein [Pseudomonas sp. XK-1]|uniref:hypothetical protein n=1 Tax=Pseudomonas sp. XK-1 TaxID=3136019 RepID=UPI00311A1A71